ALGKCLRTRIPELWRSRRLKLQSPATCRTLELNVSFALPLLWYTCGPIAGSSFAAFLEAIAIPRFASRCDKKLFGVLHPRHAVIVMVELPLHRPDRVRRLLPGVDVDHPSEDVRQEGSSSGFTFFLG